MIILKPLEALKPDATKPVDFYQFAVHLIYAIIIADSYKIAADLVIPLNIAISDYAHATKTLELFFVYFLIISGWVGYTRSISNKPHTDSLAGTVRFGLDLTILFEFFYLVHIISTGNFSGQFHFVLVAIFATYMIWDYVKCREYPEKTKKGTTSRAGKTIIFLIAFIFFAIAYQTMITLPQGSFFSNNNTTEISFIMIATVLTFIYRFWKWRTRPTRVLIPKKDKSQK